jgi:hypothetical protein
MAWRIEQINPSAPDLCRGQFAGKCCGYRIAKYKRPTVVPTFIGIYRKSGRKGTEHKQFWFCPTDVTRCIIGQTRCVVHYPDIPEMWPVKVDMNLTQTEVEGLESASFKIDDGEETLDSMHQRFLARDGLCQEQRGPRTSGDIHPTIREGKSFRFVPQPSPEHFARMHHRKIFEGTSTRLWNCLYCTHTWFNC